MKIGIAGAGGIGSNVAVNLVRSGVKCIKLVDFDRLEPSNLNRQFYFEDQIGRFKAEVLCENLQRIDATCRVEPLVLKLDRENITDIFSDCGLIVEGFDSIAAKKMLLEVLAADNRPVVSASGIAGSAMDRIRTRRLGSCHIVGDFSTDCQDAPLYAHKVIGVAAIMTDIILTQGGFYD